MPELRNVSGREAVQALQRLGFRQVRQRGSHVVLVRETPEGKTGCAVPMHQELKIGTLRGVLRQAGITVEEFVQSLQ